MDIIPLKMCRSCQTEKPKSKFSGRSATERNPFWLAKYYEHKHEHLITYAKGKYHLKCDDIPKQKRGRKRKEPPIFNCSKKKLFRNNI